MVNQIDYVRINFKTNKEKAIQHQESFKINHKLTKCNLNTQD